MEKKSKLLDRVSRVKDTLYDVITKVIPSQGTDNLPISSDSSSTTPASHDASTSKSLGQSLDLKLPSSLGNRPVVIVQNQTSVVNNLVLVNIVNALRELDKMQNDVVEADFVEVSAAAGGDETLQHPSESDDLETLVHKLAMLAVQERCNPSDLAELLREEMFLICFTDLNMTNVDVSRTLGIPPATVGTLKKKYGLTKPRSSSSDDDSNSDIEQGELDESN